LPAALSGHWVFVGDLAFKKNKADTSWLQLILFPQRLLFTFADKQSVVLVKKSSLIFSAFRFDDLLRKFKLRIRNSRAGYFAATVSPRKYIKAGPYRSCFQ